MEEDISIEIYRKSISALFYFVYVFPVPISPCTRRDRYYKENFVFNLGCDSGFGRELAEKLDKMGYHVFAGCLAPDREGARSLKESTSERLKIVPIDVTDDFQVQQAVKFVKDNIGENRKYCSLMEGLV